MKKIELDTILKVAFSIVLIGILLSLIISAKKVEVIEDHVIISKEEVVYFSKEKIQTLMHENTLNGVKYKRVFIVEKNEIEAIKIKINKGEL